MIIIVVRIVGSNTPGNRISCFLSDMKMKQELLDKDEWKD